jgi:hypothetical protein
MGKLADLLKQIDDRLGELDEERADLLRMRERYAGLVSDTSGNGKYEVHAGSPISGVATVPPKAMGMSDAIRKVISDAGSRGIMMRQMVDGVLKLASTTSANPRKAVESTAYNMRKAGHLHFANGRYYMVNKTSGTLFL